MAWRAAIDLRRRGGTRSSECDTCRMISPGAAELDQTEVGSYFVANYPPFSVWTPEAIARDARPALAAPPASRPTITAVIG